MVGGELLARCERHPRHPPAEHRRAYGLDAGGIRHSLDAFLTGGGAQAGGAPSGGEQGDEVIDAEYVDMDEGKN